METLSYGLAPFWYVVNSKWNLSERFYNIERCHRSLNTLRGFKQNNSKVYISGGYDGFLIDDEGDVRDISGIEQPAAKVRIPGLPNEPKGESGAVIRSCFWKWKPKLNVHCEKAGCENLESPQILFLPGFGVGAFHYEKQMKDLGRDFRVWALDFLGQGMSLPFEDPTLQSKEGGASNGKTSSWGFGDETEPWKVLRSLTWMPFEGF
ncbi:hypothetical protein K1719_012392 [Acacia pycnantha]|nr:hypothetical protein K1719_012392 [Acacia pycnantha]